jgi:hypothetical protein
MDYGGCVASNTLLSFFLRFVFTYVCKRRESDGLAVKMSLSAKAPQALEFIKEKIIFFFYCIIFGV